MIANVTQIGVTTTSDGVVLAAYITRHPPLYLRYQHFTTMKRNERGTRVLFCFKNSYENGTCVGQVINELLFISKKYK